VRIVAKQQSEERIIVRQGAVGLLVVLAAACGGTVGIEADADPMLRVGSCFVVEASGSVAPSPCDVRNDGVVTAEVEDVQMCGLLDAGGVNAFAVVDGRTFCLRDATP
jgi:hypothetical protein